MSTSSNTLKFTQLSSLATYSGTSASRLQALYSDFSRQKQSNPTSYQSNVDWWRRTLDAIVLKGWQNESQDRLVLHASPNLTDSFRYEGVGKPLSLSTVIAELCSSKTYIPLNYFLTSTQSVYDPGSLPLRIASYILGKPLWWALQQAGIVDGDESGSESDAQRWKKFRGDYVVLSLVEKAANAVIARQQSLGGMSLTDTLYSVETFKKVFSSAVSPDVVFSDLDVKVLLRYLERDKRVIVTEKEVIKFVDVDSEVREVTAVDRGILQLKSAVENLHAQVDNLQRKIDERTEKISLALRQKRKELAMADLRSRKQLEDLLSKRLSSLNTLQSTLMSVETAAGDVEIMKSYETSTATLQAILSDPSLQREKIDETMDAMANATADAREVDDAIRMGGDMTQAELGVDEDELEEELRQMAKEAEAEKAEKEDRQKIEDEHRKAQAEGEKREKGVTSPPLPSTPPDQSVSETKEMGRKEMASRFAALSRQRAEPAATRDSSTDPGTAMAEEDRVKEPA